LLLKQIRSNVEFTIDYFDSLKHVLNDLNVADIEAVKNIFFETQAGDSVYNSFKYVFFLCKKGARSEKTVSYIDSIENNIIKNRDVGELKRTFFSVNNPIGASMILAAYQIEIYTVGIETMNSYN